MLGEYIITGVVGWLFKSGETPSLGFTRHYSNMSARQKTTAHDEEVHAEKVCASTDVEASKENHATPKGGPKTNKQGLTLVPQPSDDPRDPLVGGKTTPTPTPRETDQRRTGRMARR